MKNILKLLIILSVSFGSQIYSQDKAEVDFLLQRISSKHDKNSLFKVTPPPKSYYITSSNRQYEIVSVNVDGLLREIKSNTDPQVIALVELKTPNQFTATKNINVNSRLGKYITVEFNISNLTELVNNNDVKSISIGGEGYGPMPELDESSKAIGLDSVRPNSSPA